VNSTKLITTYSKSLFQNSNTFSSLDPLKESFDVANITSPEQISLPAATIYVIGEELLLIRSTLVSSRNLKEFFQNPTYAEKQKLELLLIIFPGLTVTMKSFLKILAERSHLSLLPNICDQYTLLLLKFKGSTKVRLVIASILQERYGMLLLNTLKDLTASKEIILSISYNPKLLGGLILEYNSTLIDASVLNEFSLFFTEG
jgi:ATP synthase F1 delta subunit